MYNIKTIANNKPIIYNIVMKEGSCFQFSAAIIGAGAVGEYHINAQRRLGSRVLIYEPNLETSNRIKGKFPDVVATPSLYEAIERADVVHVCTPDSLHKEGALASIEGRKPVIIEKPLTRKLHESVEIYNASNASSVPVLVGTSFRATPTFYNIYRSIRQGEVGDLLSLETTYLHDMDKVNAGANWRKGLPDDMYFLYGGGSHAVDLNMWLADQEAKQVQATAAKRKGRSFTGYDDIAASIQYKNGLNGRVWLSGAASLPVHGSDINVYGTNGTYRANNKDPFVKKFIEGKNGWESLKIGLEYTIDIMSKVFNSFVRGERANFDPLPDIGDGLKVMILLDTIEKAVNSGKTERVPSLQEITNSLGK